MSTVEGVDPEHVLEEVADARDRQLADARELFDWFAQYEGTLLPASDAVPAAADDLDWPLHRVQRALVGLTDDSMDPVQTVYSPEEQYVGLIRYEVYEAEGAYVFDYYDARMGTAPRAVCARCVETEEYVEHVAHATAGQGSVAADADVQALLDKITEHYTNEHSQGPSEVDVAASLVSGTTIDGSTAWHDGNVTGGTDISVGSTSVAHSDTSTQGSVNNSGTTAIQDVSLDGRGHVTGLTSADVGGGGTSEVPWTEDGNSPLTGSGTSEASISLASDYDAIMVFLEQLQHKDNDHSNDYMKVDGTGTGYEYVDFSGSSATSQSEFQIGASLNNDDDSSGLIFVAGRFARYCTVGFWGASSEGQGSTFSTGAARNATSPVSSIQFGTSSTSGVDVTAHVYGMNP